jgi:hypothetical protein
VPLTRWPYSLPLITFRKPFARTAASKKGKLLELWYEDLTDAKTAAVAAGFTSYLTNDALLEVVKHELGHTDKFCE